MTITEKAAYLKGLVEGKGLDPEAGEGKLWHVLAELVGDMAAELSALRNDHEQLSDSLEEVEVSLDYLEELQWTHGLFHILHHTLLHYGMDMKN